MLASVLGMALSIEFGIADTYALGVGFYVICTLMIVVNRAGEDGATPGAVAVAPSIQPTQTELLADIPTDSPSTVPPTRSARTDELAE
jgi:hypothetical protein